MLEVDEKPKGKSLEYVVMAMALVVEWYDLMTFCESRSTCIGCPYRHKNMCDKRSTVSVLKSAAELFKAFLED